MYISSASSSSSSEGLADLQMSVVVDRSEGASSMADGTMEVMVHRWGERERESTYSTVQ